MALLKKKKKSKVAAEPIEEAVVTNLNVEEVDEEIQTTFNEDPEGVFEDVIFIDEETALEAEEIEKEDN